MNLERGHENNDNESCGKFGCKNNEFTKTRLPLDY